MGGTGKSRGLVRSGNRLGAAEVFEFVKVNRADYPVTTMYRLLSVSTSGFYARLKRPESTRARRDAELAAKIEAIHARSRGTYGAPRIHAELCADGEQVSRKRVARLMKARGVEGASRRKGCHTMSRDDTARPAPDLVEREFAAEAPDRL